MTTLLVDGNHLLCRCAFIPELQRLQTHKGKPTGVTFGFLRVLRATLRRFKATSCVVVWDAGRSVRRLEIYPEYKANRDEKPKPEALVNAAEQLPDIQEILPYLGVKQLMMNGYEGDDLLCLLVQLIDKDEDIVVITDDKDLLQLVAVNVSVYRPVANELIDVHNFTGEVGIPVELFTLRKAIEGDSSDNINGVRGVGEKTANKLLKETFYDEEDEEWVDFDKHSLLKEHCAGHKTKTARKVADGWKIVERNLELVDLNRVSFTDRQRKKAKAVVDSDLGSMTTDMELMKLFGKYQFNELTSKFVWWIAPFRRLT